MQKIKLGDVLDVKRGASLSGDYYAEEGKYVRLTLGNFNYPGGGFKENTSKSDIYFVGPIKPEFILNEGDIITPLTEQVSGLLGETATIPEGGKYIQSGDVGLVIPDETKLDKRFAYYLIASPIVRKQLDAAAQQTKIRHTSPDAIKACEAWIPEDISVQASIGRLLDSINEKIANNNAICANLEAMAKLLYDYWFVQFDFPDENGKPYKSSGGKMVWNDELKREIPAGWEVKPLRDVCSIVLGGTPKTEKSEYWNGDINWLNSGEVAQFPVVETELKITQQGLDNSATVLMPVGTVIISITGNLRVSFLAIDTCGNQSIVGIMENEFYKKSYLYPVLKDLLAVYNRVATGNCQQHISKGTIEESFMLCPPSSVMFEYRNKVDPVFDRIIELGHENQQLVSLRDFLLPMLMNGQVKVGA